MFNIPKLAKGGIITQPPKLFIGDTYGDRDIIPCCKSIDKYYVIYNRTKKARIKKKAAKRSWILALKREFEKPIIIKIGGAEQTLKECERNV